MLPLESAPLGTNTSLLSVVVSMEDLDGLHRTAHTLHLDEIAHLEGLQEQEDDAPRQVLQVATQCHADSQACRCQQGGKACRVHAERAYHRNDEQRDECNVDEALQERLYGRLHIAAFKHSSHKFVDELDYIASHHSEDNGEQQAFPCLQSHRCNLLNQLVHLSVLRCLNNLFSCL